MTLEELILKFQELSKNFDLFNQKLIDVESRNKVLELRLDESEKFNKRLIAALQQAEKDIKQDLKEEIYLLPTGKFYDVEIK